MIIKGYKKLEQEKQYKQNMEILKSYAKILPLAIILTFIFWLITIVILSI